MNAYLLARRGWSLFVNGLGLLFFATLFIWTIARLSAGSGAIIEVREPPRSLAFEFRESASLPPTIRVPLAGTLRYDLDWRYLEGGCETTLWHGFSKGSEVDGVAETRIRQTLRPQPIGRPGPDHLAVRMPDGLTPGLWHYTATAESECPTRRPPLVQLGSFNVDVFDPQGPVVYGTEPIEVVTPTIRVGGPFRYKFAYVRTTSAPTTVITAYLRQDPDNPEVIIGERPAGYTDAGRYPLTEVSSPVPPSVRPGSWVFRITAVTRLPNGRSQVDRLLETKVEVIP